MLFEELCECCVWVVELVCEVVDIKIVNVGGIGDL